jgi:hypothetical protein
MISNFLLATQLRNKIYADTQLVSNSHVAHMQCLAANIDQCHWGNTSASGLPDGGWSTVYLKCKLYELPEVGPLSGSEAITNWCDSKKSQVAHWKCLENNQHMCQWD